RSLELTLGPCPVAVVLKVDVSERRVRLAKRLVDFKRSRHRLSGFREPFAWRDRFLERLHERERHVGVGKPGVRAGIVAVLRNSQLKVVDGLPRCLFGSLVPVVAAFELSFTRFLVNVAALPETMFLLRRQLHSNR